MLEGKISQGSGSTEVCKYRCQKLNMHTPLECALASIAPRQKHVCTVPSKHAMWLANHGQISKHI